VVLGAEDPLKLLGGDDGDDAGASLGLCPGEIGPDVVELAVVPSRAIGLLELKDRHSVLDGEGLHLTTKAVADLLEQSGRRNREPEVFSEERDHLPAYLKLRHVSIEEESIDTVHREADVTIEDVIDVGCVGHGTSVAA